MLVQGVLLALLLLALLWTFWISPRRGTTPKEARIARRQTAGISIPAPVAQETSLELLRSLERMEADLGEMRAEVERMKTNLTEAPESRARKS
jgi:hypothetical protein